jgi:NADPH:quinone reductase-like Zn-dependent oxidoreductase
VKAIVQDTYGGTEVLALREIEKPAIADDQALVAVEAAGVTRASGT